MIYFLIYLFLEVMVSSTIAGSIGGLATFGEIMLTALIGIFLLQNYNYAMRETLNQMASGQITQDEFLRQNLFVALGAVLLIVPGFFTDILGVLLQFQFFAKLIATRLFKKQKFDQTEHMGSNYSQTYYRSNTTRNSNSKGEDDVIDVEIIDDKHIIDK